MPQKGFTLIELVVVLILVSILAVVALPRFLEVGDEAEHTGREGILSAIHSGLSIVRADSMINQGGAGVYPAELDTNPDNSPCTSCFSNILAYGVNDANWTRLSSTQYQFFDGTSTTVYTYDPASGTFE